MPRTSGRRLALSLAFLWELLRLGGIYVALIRYFDAQALIRAQLSLLWFGAGQLAVAAGIAAAVYDYARFRAVLPILALAKALTLVVGVAVLASAALVEPGVPSLDFSVDPYAVVLPLVVVNLDLLSIAFLILFSRANRTATARGDGRAHGDKKVGGDDAARRRGAATGQGDGSKDGGHGQAAAPRRDDGHSAGGHGHETERIGPVRDDELPDFRETQIDEEYEDEQ